MILHCQYVHLAAVNLFKLESKLSTCLWDHWATLDSFQSLSLFWFSHACMHVFIYKHMISSTTTCNTISMFLFMYIILFRSQTYHMSLSKILWLHRLRFTMGRLTQRRAVGDDPGNVNIKAWRWSKIMKLSWNHHQPNPSLSYSTSKRIAK